MMYLRLKQFEKQKTKDLILWLIFKLIFIEVIYMFFVCIASSGNSSQAK